MTIDVTPDISAAMQLEARKDAEGGTLAATAAARRSRRDASFEAVVVGGGLSGTCAALAAARTGARTALVHNRPMLGGNSSSETRLSPEFANWFTPWARESGIIEELYADDRIRNHEPWVEATVNAMWDLVLYEAASAEPNLTVLLNTHVHDVTVEGDRLVSVDAVQLGAELAHRLSAEIFLDATGTGFLGYLAGADFTWGREGREAYGEPLQPARPDEETMGNTMYFRSRAVEREISFSAPDWASRFEDDAALGPFRAHNWIDVGYYWLEVGRPHHVIHDAEAIKREQVRQVLGVWDHIKNRGEHGADRYALEWIAWWPYRRENRRLLGPHVLTQSDVQQPPAHDDSVAFGAWSIDVHTIGGILQSPAPTLELELLVEGVNPYPIPLRSLYSRNVANLLMAGRNISCSWVAFSSTRILPTGAVTGQAAGTAAALCVARGILPDELASDHVRELQQRLLRDDQYIPGLPNEDAADLARGTSATGSSDAPLAFPEPNAEQELVAPMAQIFPVSAARVEEIDLRLISTLDQPVTLTVRLGRAVSVWEPREELAVTEVEVAPGRSWATARFGVDVEARSLCFVSVDAQPGVSWAEYNDALVNTDVYAAMTGAASTSWYTALRDLEIAPCPVPVGTTALARRDLIAGTYFGGRRWNPSLSSAGRYAPHSFALRVRPEPRPYGPENVTSGKTRPEDWTHIWCSDPSVPLPQWLELAFPDDTELDTVQITFDTDLSYKPERPLHVPPSCVSDYRLLGRREGEWVTIASVTGNHRRRRVHTFDPLTTRALRLEITRTHGDPSARVYEVRAYRER